MLGWNKQAICSLLGPSRNRVMEVYLSMVVQMRRWVGMSLPEVDGREPLRRDPETLF